MLIKIASEFDSVDTAERAARTIKDHISDINSINIINPRDGISGHNNTIAYISPAYSSQQTPTETSQPYYSRYSGLVIDYTNNTEQTETALSTAVILEVICDKIYEQEVNQIFISLGGLRATAR